MADETTGMTGPAGGSNDQKPTAPPQAPEPVILEEVIIKKEPKQPAAASAPAVATPTPAAPKPTPLAPPPTPLPPPQPSAPIPPQEIPPSAMPPTAETTYDTSAVTGLPKLVRKDPGEAKKPSFAPLPPLFKQAPKIAPESLQEKPSATVAKPSVPPSIPTKPPAAIPVPTKPAVAAIPPGPADVPLPPPVQKKPAPNLPPIETTLGDNPLQADVAKILESVKLPERRDMKGAADIQPTPKIIAPPPPPTTTPRPEPQAKPADIVVAMHTLKDDLQHVVQEQKISVVHAVSLEETRRHKEEKPPTTQGATQRSRRTAGILFAVVLLLVLGAGALFGVYTVMHSRAGIAAPQISSILFAESTVSLTLQGQQPRELKQLIAAAREQGGGTLGSITRVLPIVLGEDGIERPATTQEFLQALGVHAPDELARALSSDFFFGIHTVDKNAPILLIPVTSYAHAFSGMLAWEDSVNADLAPVFTAVAALTTDAQGLPVKRTFSDLVMRNYDARALKDDAGNIQLYYSFPTQGILVIAESPYSFNEILSRLQANRQL